MLRILVALVFTCFSVLPMALAADDPVEERHELMEEMKDAAGPIGGMLKGEVEFDNAQVMKSLNSMWEGAAVFGNLFPEGSYVGGEEKAKETVWTDRAGFDQQLVKFQETLNVATMANPQNLEELKTVAPAVFKNCKSCHEDYRIPGD